VGVEEWYIRCIEDHLVDIMLMKRSDDAEIILNDSDKTFLIEVYHMNGGLRVGENSRMKGTYEIEKDFLNLKFLNKVFKVKI
jgi:hypothetical protein